MLSIRSRISLLRSKINSRIIIQQMRHGLRSQPLPIIKLNTTQTGAIITLPGYGYDDLDRHGHVRLNRVARCAEAARLIQYSPAYSGTPSHEADTYSDILSHVFKEKLILMITALYTIFPGFYDKRHLYNPVTVEDRIINIGKSSYQHLNVAASDVTGQLLHESVTTAVLVDRLTRKQTGFPSRFNEYFEDKRERVAVKRVSALGKPAATHLCLYRVRYSDIDYYMHVNHSSYIPMCLDSMIEVARRGVLTVLTGDIGRHQVKTLECLYQKETMVEDTLEIHVWENEDNPYILHAIAENHGQAAFQCSVEFVPLDQTSEL